MRKQSTIEANLLSAVKGLPKEKIAEVVDFACYLRVREKIREKETDDFDIWAEDLAAKKGFDKLTKDEVARIVMECRSESRAQA